MSAFLNNETEYYSVSIVDKNLGYFCFQYILFLYSILYVCAFNVRIVYLIRRHKQLTTSANIIIGGVLICDITCVVLYSVTGIFLSFGDKVWLPNRLCKLLTFLVTFPTGLQRCFLAIGSLEKLYYFILVYKHPVTFSVERTLKYIATAVTFSFFSSLIGSIGTVFYDADFLLCSITLGNLSAAKFVVKLLAFSRVLFLIVIVVATFFLQMVIFIWCWKASKTDITLRKGGQMWKRMIRNFISLFSVTFVIVASALGMHLAFNLDSPLLKRMTVFSYVYGTSFLNPLIVLTGNQPLWKSFIKQKKTIITNYTVNTISR